LEKRKIKHFTLATSALKQLESQRFACQPDATDAAIAFSQQLPYHQLHDLQAIEIVKYARRGRPCKDAVGQKHYQICATLVPKASVIDAEQQRAGLFLLATNVLDEQVLTDDQILQEYKAQQSTERGFRFLKDPLYHFHKIVLQLVGIVCVSQFPNIKKKNVRSCSD
jgi:transposase